MLILILLIKINARLIDGWLGIIIGSKIYYKFTSVDSNQFEEKFSSLLKEINSYTHHQHQQEREQQIGIKIYLILLSTFFLLLIIYFRHTYIYIFYLIRMYKHFSSLRIHFIMIISTHKYVCNVK